MAITGSSSIEYKSDEKTRYESLDNVKDITKLDLKNLKSELKLDEEVNLESELKAVNDHIENYFDGVIRNHREEQLTFDFKGTSFSDTPKNIVASGDKEKLDAFIKYIANKSGYEKELDDTLNDLKNEEIKKVLKEYKFELKDLRNEVKEPTANKETSSSDKEDNPFNAEGYDITQQHAEAYPEWSYAEGKIHPKDMEDIYKDNRVPKVLEKMLDPEDKNDIRKGLLRINLGTENGLAGIILAIREAAKYKDKDIDETDPNYKYVQILNGIKSLNVDSDSGDISFSGNEKNLRKDIQTLIDAGYLKYEHKGGLDRELNKVAKILMRADRKNIDTFTSLVQSKSDIAMATKEWYNSNEVKNLIDKDNVLQFLCDINGDGLLSVDQKKQKTQGDVGTLFGQQIYFTLEQAIAVKDAELGKGAGEKLVIANIIKNMEISDYRSLTKIQQSFIDGMIDTPENCTKANLALLIKGYNPTEEEKEKDESDVKTGNMEKAYVLSFLTKNDITKFDGMPEMKTFFLDAIKKLNGGSSEVQPDLFETLTGDEAQAIIDTKENKTELKNIIDGYLADIPESETEIRKLIHEQGIVRVRETIFIKMMDAVDGVEITTNDGRKGTITQLQAAGISKSRELQTRKNELLKSAIKTLVLSGIHYSKTGGLRLTIGYGKELKSDSGRTLGNRGTGGGLIFAPGNVSLGIELGAAIAEQYNHKNVINASLANVKSAKYIGIEGGALARIGLTDRGVVSPEAYAGVNRQQDPLAGINQINEQYRAVTEEIFKIDSISQAEAIDKEIFRARIQKNIDIEKTDKTYGKFVKNNEQYFTDNLNFIVKYMDANKFFGTDGKLSKLPEIHLTNALNTLLDIIQSGNIEQRRSDVVAGLQGKISLTKLSFGVTTNALTLKHVKSAVNTAPTAEATSGETTEAGNVSAGDTGASESALGQEKFGVAGFYIGARLSTWKNTYVPNDQQYLYTQYEMGQGINAEYIKNPEHDLKKYADYLQAVYNDPRLICKKDPASNKLIITFTPRKDGTQSLTEFLDLHITSDAEKNFSLINNVLTIGDVGKIGAYTVTEAKGVRRTLSLGSEKLDETHRVIEDKENTEIPPITDKENGNKDRTAEKLKDTIICNIKGIGAAAQPEVVETIETEITAFFDKDGNLTPPPTLKTTFDPADIVGKKLKNGTLTITKNTDLTYTIKLDESTSKDSLTITYIDQKTYETSRKAAEKIETNRVSKEAIPTSEIKNTFALPTRISSVFVKNTERILSVFDEYNNKTLYKDFMESIVDPGLDSFIDNTDYTAAFATLKKILENKPEYTELTDLKTLIDSTISAEEKMLIVDKFKTIFSYVTEITDGKNDGVNLTNEINNRHKDTYKTMKGPDGTIYPLTTDYRKNIIENLKGENMLTRTRVENLIGFTAFYKLNGRGRKYAMSPLGGTNVLAGPTLEKSIISLEGEDIAKAQDRLISNLDVNKDNKKMVVEKINLLLKKNNITITEIHLPDLLRGKSIILDSGEKINIDINPVFYLLGECANESLGMEIKKINISTLKETTTTTDIPGTITTIEGKYSATGTAEKEYINGINLYAKSHSIASGAISEVEGFGLIHHTSINTSIPLADSTSGATTGGGTDNPGPIDSGGGENE